MGSTNKTNKSHKFIDFAAIHIRMKVTVWIFYLVYNRDLLLSRFMVKYILGITIKYFRDYFTLHYLNVSLPF